MSEGGFSLHKWHSNVGQLNSVEKVTEGEETYTKSLVGNRGNGETKILGTLWNKAHDTLSIDFKTCLKVDKPLTKGRMISAINSIYDLFGWGSPVTITAKLLLVKYAFWSYIETQKCQPRFKENGNRGQTACRKRQPWPYHAVFSSIIEPTLRFMVLRMRAKLLFVLHCTLCHIKTRQQ